MANKILLDVNVCLDFLLKRRPFSDSAGLIFEAAEQNRVEAVISTISFDTMFYILRPSLGSHRATDRLRELTVHTNIGTVSEQVVQKALTAGWNDLEDAIQYFSADAAGCDAVITRDDSGFTPNGISVLSPDEYISTYLSL